MKQLTLSLLVLFLWSCGSKENKRPSIYEGTINIGIDGSIRPVIDAETDAYRVHYKGANFNKFDLPETQAIKYFLEDSMDVICISRKLNAEEMKYIEKQRKDYKPAPFALDAVVLVAHPNATFQNFSLSDLRKLFTETGSNVKMVFDQSSSSNLNLLLDTLGISEFNRKNVVAAGSNEKIFDFVKKDKNAIGFVGYNFISEDKSAETVKLRESVKIIGINNGRETVYADKHSIIEQEYPLFRTIYLHTLSTAWGVEDGFIRFACSKPGQLIAEKMGLVPYYKIPKQFVISKEPLP